jgi:hypothetical protein
MAYVMNLRGVDFYTQRNNKWDDPRTPHHERVEGCMPTTRAMFYRGNDIPFSNPSEWSDDDYFMKVLRSAAAYDYAEMNFPGLIKKYPPNQIHGMYMWLDEVVCGRRRSIFHEAGLTFAIARGSAKAGKCLMVSGTFCGLAGHAVLIAGYFDDKLLLADPWGDFRNGYRATKYVRGVPKYGGDAVGMDETQFNEILKWGETKGYHEPI